MLLLILIWVLAHVVYNGPPTDGMLWLILVLFAGNIYMDGG